MSRQSAERQSSPSAQAAHGERNSPGASTALDALVQRAQAEPTSLTAPDVLGLQRAIGNRATGRLLAQNLSVQAKLQLGPANDKYEQEADDVARQVVRRMAAPPVQRSEESDEEIQAKPLYHGVSSLSSTQPPPVKRTFVAPPLQREEMDDEEGVAQASALHGMEGGEVETSVADTIQRARGGGSALDPNTRSGMERAFGADFGGVRVHTDAQADTLNRSLNARAFTTGNDIFFRRGEFNPGSGGGKELLAHELTHTVQQGATGVQRLQPAPMVSGLKPIRVLKDHASSVRRHADKGQLEEQIKLWPSAIAKTLMDGVLDQPNADAAVRKVYDNMFAYAQANWKYKAAFGGRDGASIIEGRGAVGMCETYRNTFKYMLEQYLIPLTKDYDPFSGGFDVQEGQELVTTKFVTKEGLRLLGNASGYNVVTEIDARTGVETPVQRYLFSSHWQLIVNGKTFDPLFQSIDVDNIEWKITNLTQNYYSSDGGDISFAVKPGAGPTPGGEFAGQYVLVRNASALKEMMNISDAAEFGEEKLTDVRKEIEAVKLEWLTIKDNKIGKTRWRKPIQKKQAPLWITTIEEVREKARSAKLLPASDSLRDKLVSQTAGEVLDEVAFRGRQASAEIKDFRDTTHTSEVGRFLDNAIKHLDSALAECRNWSN